MTALVKTNLDRLRNNADAIENNALRPHTRRAYASDWRRYTAFAETHDLDTGALATAKLFLTHEAEGGLRLATLQRRVASIRHYWDQAAPELTVFLRGLYNGNQEPQRHAPALPVERLRAWAQSAAPSVRDRAVVLVAFAAALRRSELVALQRDAITIDERGARLELHNAKTDKGNAGQSVFVRRGHGATCPVGALETWLDSHDDERAFPMHSETVSRIVHRHFGEPYTAHSLRAGCATAAAAAGVPDRETMAHTRHKSIAVFARYAQNARGFDNAATGVV